MLQALSHEAHIRDSVILPQGVVPLQTFVPWKSSSFVGHLVMPLAFHGASRASRLGKWNTWNISAVKLPGRSCLPHLCNCVCLESCQGGRESRALSGHLHLSRYGGRNTTTTRRNLHLFQPPRAVQLSSQLLDAAASPCSHALPHHGQRGLRERERITSIDYILTTSTAEPALQRQGRSYGTSIPESRLWRGLFRWIKSHKVN